MLRTCISCKFRKYNKCFQFNLSCVESIQKCNGKFFQDLRPILKQELKYINCKIYGTFFSFLPFQFLIFQSFDLPFIFCISQSIYLYLFYKINLLLEEKYINTSEKLKLLNSFFRN